jgi:hypothetical protein
MSLPSARLRSGLRLLRKLCARRRPVEPRSSALLPSAPVTASCAVDAAPGPSPRRRSLPCHRFSRVQSLVASSSSQRAQQNFVPSLRGPSKSCGKHFALAPSGSSSAAKCQLAAPSSQISWRRTFDLSWKLTAPSMHATPRRMLAASACCVGSVSPCYGSKLTSLSGGFLSRWSAFGRPLSPLPTGCLRLAQGSSLDAPTVPCPVTRMSNTS